MDMIQIIGTRKSADTRKAERFFKERGVPYHFVDLTERSLSKGELENISRSIPLEELIDTESKEYAKRGMAYMEFDFIEELLEHPLLMKVPVVRWNRRAVMGIRTDTWKQWSDEAKGAI